MKQNGKNIIFDDDITLTGEGMQGEKLSQKLGELSSSVKKLSSNLKWIYKYGGVGGGNGKGGGRGSSSFSIGATLGKNNIRNGADIVLPGGKGKYRLALTIENPGGSKFLMTVKYKYLINNVETDRTITREITALDEYKFSGDIDLNANTKLEVRVSDTVYGGLPVILETTCIITPYDFKFELSGTKNDEIFSVNEASGGVELYPEGLKEKGLAAKIDWLVAVANPNIRYEILYQRGSSSPTIIGSNTIGANTDKRGYEKYDLLPTMLAGGDDRLSLNIESSNGLTLFNKAATTDLTAVVKRGYQTIELPRRAYTWTRRSGDINPDNNFNNNTLNRASTVRTNLGTGPTTSLDLTVKPYYNHFTYNDRLNGCNVSMEDLNGRFGLKMTNNLSRTTGEVTLTVTQEGAYGAQRYRQLGIDTPGDYIVSYEVKSTTNIDNFHHTLSEHPSDRITIGNEWKKVVAKHKVTKYIGHTNPYYGFIDFYLNTGNGAARGSVISIRNIKIYKATEELPDELFETELNSTITLTHQGSGIDLGDKAEGTTSEEFSKAVGEYSISANIFVTNDGDTRVINKKINLSVISQDLYLIVRPSDTTKALYQNRVFGDIDTNASYGTGRVTLLARPVWGNRSGVAADIKYKLFKHAAGDGIPQPVRFSVGGGEPREDHIASQINLKDIVRIPVIIHDNEDCWYQLRYEVTCEVARYLGSVWFHVSAKQESVEWPTVKRTSAGTIKYLDSIYSTGSAFNIFRRGEEPILSNTNSRITTGGILNLGRETINIDQTSGELEINDIRHIYSAGSLANSADTKHISIGISYNEVNDVSKPIATLTGQNGSGINCSLVIYQNKMVLTVARNVYTMEYYLPVAQIDKFGEDVADSFALLTFISRVVKKTNLDTFYENVVYINGVLEGYGSFIKEDIRFDKVVLNEGVYLVNLLEIDAFPTKRDEVSGYWINEDYFVYQQYLKYREALLGSPADEIEKATINYSREYTVHPNGDVTVPSEDTITNVLKGENSTAKVPILFISLDENTDTNRPKVRQELNQPYEDNSVYYKYPSRLKWCREGQNVLEDVTVPEGLKFNIQIQGSSTKGYKCKNFELSLEPDVEDREFDYLFSPNIDKNDPETFLPEKSFTLKADVVDSGHSNNTAIGRFINKATTKFNTGSKGVLSKHVKNCLDGFPILVYLEVVGQDKTSTIYYQGVYNFNLGRNSEFNLGYRNIEGLMKRDGSGLLDNEAGAGSPFYIMKAETSRTEMHESLMVAEIQGNSPYFDFSQSHTDILFPTTDNDRTYMYGDIVSGSIGVSSDWKVDDRIKEALSNLTKAITLGGAFLFDTIGKKNFPEDPESLYGYRSEAGGYGNYTIETINGGAQIVSKNIVPNFKYVMDKNKSDSRIKWSGNKLRDLSGKEVTTLGREYLVDLISPSTAEGTSLKPWIDYTSIVEYYVICMAFGLVDSVQKNLNLKSWSVDMTDPAKKGTYYAAFYDMDTSLGIDNLGLPTDYKAFSDYWTTGFEGEDEVIYPNPTTVYRDFFPSVELYDKTGTRTKKRDKTAYDVPSSYLFSVAKYAFFDELRNSAGLGIGKYWPKDLWALMRKRRNENSRNEGILENADYFMDNFYKNNLKSVNEFLISMNYRNKYFVTVEGENTVEFDRTNVSKFRGTRYAYVRDWLESRLHTLDGFFNIHDSESRTYRSYVEDLSEQVSNGDSVLEPGIAIPENRPVANSDVFILNSIFSESSEGYQIPGEVRSSLTVKARPMSPVVVKTSNVYDPYILTDPNKKYVIPFSVQNQYISMLGSLTWTYIEKLDPMLVSGQTLYLKSKYLENLSISRECTTSPVIDSSRLDLPNLKEISINSPTVVGSVEGNNRKFRALSKVDLSNSNITLNLTGSKVTEVIADNMIGGDIILRDCNYLKKVSLVRNAELFRNDPTRGIRTLTLTPMPDDVFSPIGTYWSHFVTGTNVEELNLSITDDRPEERRRIWIENEPNLKRLSLSGFVSIRLGNLPNLQELVIKDDDDHPVTFIRMYDIGMTVDNEGRGAVPRLYVNRDRELEIPYRPWSNKEDRAEARRDEGYINLSNLKNLRKLMVNKVHWFSDLILNLTHDIQISSEDTGNGRAPGVENYSLNANRRLVWISPAADISNGYGTVRADQTGKLIFCHGSFCSGCAFSGRDYYGNDFRNYKFLETVKDLTSPYSAYNGAHYPIRSVLDRMGLTREKFDEYSYYFRPNRYHIEDLITNRVSRDITSTHALYSSVVFNYGLKEYREWLADPRRLAPPCQELKLLTKLSNVNRLLSPWPGHAGPIGMGIVCKEMLQFGQDVTGGINTISMITAQVSYPDELFITEDAFKFIYKKMTHLATCTGSHRPYNSGNFTFAFQGAHFTVVNPTNGQVLEEVSLKNLLRPGPGKNEELVFIGGLDFPLETAPRTEDKNRYLNLEGAFTSDTGEDMTPKLKHVINFLYKNNLVAGGGQGLSGSSRYIEKYDGSKIKGLNNLFRNNGELVSLKNSFNLNNNVDTPVDLSLFIKWNKGDKWGQDHRRDYIQSLWDNGSFVPSNPFDYVAHEAINVELFHDDIGNLNFPKYATIDQVVGIIRELVNVGRVKGLSYLFNNTAMLVNSEEAILSIPSDIDTTILEYGVHGMFRNCKFFVGNASEYLSAWSRWRNEGREIEYKPINLDPDFFKNLLRAKDTRRLLIRDLFNGAWLSDGLPFDWLGLRRESITDVYVYKANDIGNKSSLFVGRDSFQENKMELYKKLEYTYDKIDQNIYSTAQRAFYNTLWGTGDTNTVTFNTELAHGSVKFNQLRKNLGSAEGAINPGPNVTYWVKEVLQPTGITPGGTRYTKANFNRVSTEYTDMIDINNSGEKAYMYSHQMSCSSGMAELIDGESVISEDTVNIPNYPIPEAARRGLLLPPDVLYGLGTNTIVTNMFGSSGIDPIKLRLCGTIPRNIFKEYNDSGTVYSGSNFSGIWSGQNIIPIYYGETLLDNGKKRLLYSFLPKNLLNSATVSGLGDFNILLPPGNVTDDEVGDVVYAIYHENTNRYKSFNQASIPKTYSETLKDRHLGLLTYVKDTGLVVMANDEGRVGVPTNTFINFFFDGMFHGYAPAFYSRSIVVGDLEAGSWRTTPNTWKPIFNVPIFGEARVINRELKWPSIASEDTAFYNKVRNYNPAGGLFPPCKVVQMFHIDKNATGYKYVQTLRLTNTQIGGSGDNYVRIIGFPQYRNSWIQIIR